MGGNWNVDSAVQKYYIYFENIHSAVGREFLVVISLLHRFFFRLSFYRTVSAGQNTIFIWLNSEVAIERIVTGVVVYGDRRVGCCFPLCGIPRGTKLHRCCTLAYDTDSLLLYYTFLLNLLLKPNTSGGQVLRLLLNTGGVLIRFQAVSRQMSERH